MKWIIQTVLGLILIAVCAFYFYFYFTYDKATTDVEAIVEEKIEVIEKKQDSLQARVPLLKDLIVREAYTYKQNTDRITHLLASPLGDTTTYNQQVKDSVRAFLSHTLTK